MIDFPTVISYSRPGRRLDRDGRSIREWIDMTEKARIVVQPDEIESFTNATVEMSARHAWQRKIKHTRCKIVEHRRGKSTVQIVCEQHVQEVQPLRRIEDKNVDKKSDLRFRLDLLDCLVACSMGPQQILEDQERLCRVVLGRREMTEVVPFDRIDIGLIDR